MLGLIGAPWHVLPRHEDSLRYDNFIHNLKAIASRGRLPHWQAHDAIYFVTFRLRDSLPVDIVRGLVLEREHLARTCENATDRSKLDAAFSVRLDHELDVGRGSCLLREHAELVANALCHFDGLRYELHAWCVMPNHVHVMLRVNDGADLQRIIHSWKSFTAHRIGRGVIWQREYFDRVVRGPADYVRMKAYVRANPRKAGLIDWPWIG
jgi:REP element-mobilizing transposase RayT